MTAITFPNSPSSGDTHTAGNGIVYTYDGEKWTSIGTNSAGTWTRSGTEVSLTNAGDDLNVDSGTLFVDASTDRVGIGTTSVSAGLHVVKDVNPVLKLDRGTANTANANWYYNGTLTGQVSAANADYQLSAVGASTPMSFYVNGSQRMRIDSSGNVGIGTTSPVGPLTIQGPAATNGINQGIGLLYSNGVSYGALGLNNTTGWPQLMARAGSGLTFHVNSDLLTTGEAARIDSSGNVGIGTTSPDFLLDVNGSIGITEGAAIQWHNGAGSVSAQIYGDSSDNLVFRNTSSVSERMRIDSSGNVGIGTSSPSANLHVKGDSGLKIHASSANTTAVLELAGTRSLGAAAVAISRIKSVPENPTGNHDNTALTFETRENTAGVTEKMRIDSSGRLLIGTTLTTLYNQNASTSQGTLIGQNGDIQLARVSDQMLLLNRMLSDGRLQGFYGQGHLEGDITISGTTVSYNGAHLARWSQLPGGADRTEILRGSVLSNLDEMCEWGEEDNEQLNRMKVSDVEGDRNVSGVFQAWDDDDDTYSNDFYCAMTGDFVIRIAQGTTVARGDLLMSAGDGTAKPQDDDIVRSKTVAKVTSTTVSETYSDGSYCVPCVLMAC